MLMLETEEMRVQVHSHIRPLDPHKDLLIVADLIELAFASTMDQDGREYLRQMRQAAHDETFLRWMPRAGETSLAPVHGYVWEEDGRVVGNLSLIPYRKQNQKIFLIANVAVHPDYRRRGIARELTQAAITYARQNQASSVWLQVREENEAAHHLYRSLGFLERTRRTTWMNHPIQQIAVTDPSISVTPRKGSDWRFQKAWLLETYPPDITWNLPFDVNRLRPSIFNDLYLFMMNEESFHWAARRNGELIGILTWESTHAFADSLWLAAPSVYEDDALRALLPKTLRTVSPRRSLSFNYPAGRAVSTLESCNFSPHQTLIWMEVNFKHLNYSG